MSWRVIDYCVNDCFENMAIDEAIFSETIKHQSRPTLRFYGWRPSAVSIGYFQDFEKEINVSQCRTANVDVVRRLTGGKAVYHCDEMTYSLVAGSSEKIFPDSISGTYEKISLCLARGLSELGIRATLAEKTTKMAVKDPEMVSCCFSVPSGNELLADGRKICGSAQMRTRGGFLQHGALLMAFDPASTASLILNNYSSHQSEKLRNSVVAVNDLMIKPVTARVLCEVLKKGFAEELGIDFVGGFLTPEEEKMSKKLTEKYRSDAWNRRRKKDSPQSD